MAKGKNKHGGGKRKASGGEKRSRRERNQVLSKRHNTRSRGGSRYMKDLDGYNTELENLKRQLEEMCLYLKEIAGDGNCLFRALSDQFYGDAKNFGEIRSEVVNFIEQDKDFYKDYVEDEETIDTHIARMRKNGTYGGNMELAAFARLHHVNIRIYQPDMIYIIRDHDRESEEAQPLEDEDVRTLHVAYHSYEHYSSVRNVNGPHTGDPMIVCQISDFPPSSHLPPTPAPSVNSTSLNDSLPDEESVLPPTPLSASVTSPKTDNDESQSLEAVHGQLDPTNHDGGKTSKDGNDPADQEANAKDINNKTQMEVASDTALTTDTSFQAQNGDQIKQEPGLVDADTAVQAQNGDQIKQEPGSVNANTTVQAQAQDDDQVKQEPSSVNANTTVQAQDGDQIKQESGSINAVTAVQAQDGDQIKQEPGSVNADMAVQDQGDSRTKQEPGSVNGKDQSSTSSTSYSVEVKKNKFYRKPLPDFVPVISSGSTPLLTSNQPVYSTPNCRQIQVSSSSYHNQSKQAAIANNKQTTNKRKRSNDDLDEEDDTAAVVPRRQSKPLSKKEARALRKKNRAKQGSNGANANNENQTPADATDNRKPGTSQDRGGYGKKKKSKNQGGHDQQQQQQGSNAAVFPRAGTMKQLYI